MRVVDTRISPSTIAVDRSGPARQWWALPGYGDYLGVFSMTHTDQLPADIQGLEEFLPWEQDQTRA
jgi:hypothetical protein